MSTIDPGLPKAGRRYKRDVHIADWKGPYKPYDLIKEVTIATIVVVLLTVALSVLFSSPDDPPVTIQQWARNDPVDFVQTAITELNGTSATASYGPPYNSQRGSTQYIGPVSLEILSGVHIPVNTAENFVLHPLSTIPADPTLTLALNQYETASANQQAAWTTAYATAAGNATESNGTTVVATTGSGPVGTLMSSLLLMAQDGGLDGALIASKQFYTTDYTQVLLFLSDGSYLGQIASARHLDGEQWGMMNETESWPGQAWLWLYTMWYQLPPFSTSSNGDALVWATMMVLSLILLCVPFIPGIRSIPRWTRVYRLIWNRHYRMIRAQDKSSR